MKKILKSLGKLIALPISIILLLITFMMIPLRLLEKVLVGEGKEIIYKLKTVNAIVKKSFTNLLNRKPFSTSTETKYVDKEECISLVKNFYFDGDNLHKDNHINSIKL